MAWNPQRVVTITPLQQFVPILSYPRRLPCVRDVLTGDDIYPDEMLDKNPDMTRAQCAIKLAAELNARESIAVTLAREATEVGEASE